MANSNLAYCEPAVTNARFAPLHRLPAGPVPLSTPPVPLLKPCARPERHWQCAAEAAAFRYAESGITEVIPHPVLCRMSVGSAFETFRLSVWVRHKNGRH
jgi:hypothetical protein